MNISNLPQNPTGINGSKGQKSAPGTFATGKGTTALIIEKMADKHTRTVAEAASELGLPARQLNKRFAELVKKGALIKAGTYLGHNEYRAA